ncbi:MAG: hypothetical protein P8X57_09725 [Cyclobacteriaceae bacterium]
MEFDDYLISKKIDPEAFKKNEPDQYQEFAGLFMQMHPQSFTMQKLYLINGIRRSFPLPPEKWVKDKPAASKPAKPVIKKPKAPSGSKPKFRPKPIIKKK